jgi:hypothetical protein
MGFTGYEIALILAMETGQKDWKWEDLGFWKSCKSYGKKKSTKIVWDNKIFDGFDEIFDGFLQDLMLRAHDLMLQTQN